MIPAAAIRIRSALERCSEGDPTWALEIARTLVDLQYSVALPEVLEPTVKERFADCDPDSVNDRHIAEVLAQSPILADRAVAHLLEPSLPDAEPAVIVDWREPGATWFVVYADHSMMDPSGVPWRFWESFLDEVDRAEEGETAMVYLDPRGNSGRLIRRMLARSFLNLGYRVG